MKLTRKYLAGLLENTTGLDIDDITAADWRGPEHIGNDVMTAEDDEVVLEVFDQSLDCGGSPEAIWEFTLKQLLDAEVSGDGLSLLVSHPDCAPLQVQVRFFEKAYLNLMAR